jgi:Holliday junction resolvase RusA-like endonuclease
VMATGKARAGVIAPQKPAGEATGAFSLHATLPMPPSVNHLFATYRGRRIPTREYKAWREEAGRLVAWPRLTEDARNQIPWTATITAFGLSRRRDADNIIKPTLDLITAQTGLRDNWCERVTVERSAVQRDEPCVFVIIEIAA